MEAGPQQHCFHIPAVGWMEHKLLPKQNPLLMLEQSLHRNQSCQRLEHNVSLQHLINHTKLLDCIFSRVILTIVPLRINKSPLERIQREAPL